jgi:hypothetical protein
MSSGFGCAQREETSEEIQTSTIKPAIPPPTEDNDPMTTQTVEVGEDRSPNEGAFQTDPEPDAVSGGATEAGARPTPR